MELQQEFGWSYSWSQNGVTAGVRMEVQLELGWRYSWSYDGVTAGVRMELQLELEWSQDEVRLDEFNDMVTG